MVWVWFTHRPISKIQDELLVEKNKQNKTWTNKTRHRVNRQINIFTYLPSHHRGSTHFTYNHYKATIISLTSTNHWCYFYDFGMNHLWPILWCLDQCDRALNSWVIVLLWVMTFIDNFFPQVSPLMYKKLISFSENDSFFLPKLPFFPLRTFSNRSLGVLLETFLDM